MTTKTAVKIGMSAPKFKLPAHANGVEQISLDDFIGKKNVILAFYPKDQTPGCTKEMCAFSEDLKHFELACTQVLGISCDSVPSHGKFVEKYNLQQPLLADVGGTVGIAYGAVEAGKSTAQRVTFVIDKKGIIQEIIEGMPSNAELLEIVKKLK